VRELPTPVREPPTPAKESLPRNQGTTRDFSKSAFPFDSGEFSANNPRDDSGNPGRSPSNPKKGCTTENGGKREDIRKPAFPSNSRVFSTGDPKDDTHNPGALPSGSNTQAAGPEIGLQKSTHQGAQTTNTNSKNYVAQHPATMPPTLVKGYNEPSSSGVSSTSERPSTSEEPHTSPESVTTEERTLSDDSGSTEAYYKPPPAPPPTAEYCAYAEDFISKNLSALYDPNSPQVQQMMETAAFKAEEIMKKYELSPDLTRGLTKLALYDFVILCGQSPLQRDFFFGGGTD
jgi:hypothetical protein